MQTPTHVAASVAPVRTCSGLPPRLAGFGLAVLAAVLVVLRPLTPFEWDEVLFLRALDGYDVARHAPHPPGYPLYVAAAWALARAGLGHLLALQLVSLLGAVVAVVASGAAVRRFGAGGTPVLLAGVLLGATPAFAFHATVGMSDALATGLAATALWAAAAVAVEPGSARHLVMLAIAAAAAAAARPQTLALVALPGAWAAACELRRRRWRTAVVAVAIGALVSAACWLPAVLLTGWVRYWRAVDAARRWVETAERGYRLPGAPLGLVADAWLVRPFGTPVLAAVFWLLVVLGAVAWWRAGRRGLVLLAAPAAVCYLGVAAFTMQLDTAVRYALPVMPCLAMLAAGVTCLEPRLLGRVAVAAAVASTVASAAWLAPTLALRAREPAPAWATLEWVRHHAPPGTTIVFDVGLKPHAQYVLGASGLRLVEAGRPEAARLTAPSWRLRLDPGPELTGVVPFEARWPPEPLGSLTRHRYLAAAVVAPGG